MPPASRPSRWQIGAVLTVGILSASTAAILIRLALESGAEQVTDRKVGFSLFLAAARLTAAALLLAPTWRSVWRQSVWTRSSSPPQPQFPALRDSIAAGVFLALHFATWVTSLSYTSIAASTALVTTNPIWVALLSWVWFQEKPTWLTSTGIAIALISSLIVSLADASAVGSNPLLGNLLALVGSWAVSFYFLLGRQAQRRGLSISQHILITYSTAALVLLPFPPLFGVSYFNHPPPVYLCILLMALFPQLIGHTSFNWAVRWISPTLVTLVILAEPIGSSLLGFLIFQENPGLQVLLGAIGLLGGVAIAAVGTRGSEG